MIGCEDNPNDLSWQTFVENYLCARQTEEGSFCCISLSFMSFSVGGYIQRGVTLHIARQVLCDNQGHLNSGTLRMCQMCSCVL